MKQEVYDIGGMHCAACAAAVERVTRKLPGVNSSAVNLTTGRMTVEYDESLTGESAIIAKVEAAGFTARLHRAENGGKSAAVSEDGDTARELRRKRTGLIVSGVFSAVLLFFSMGHMLFPQLPLPDIIAPGAHPQNFALLQLLLTLPALIIGREYFTGGFGALLRGNPNMNTLVALSASVSFVYSVVVTFMLADSPHMVHSLYYESAAVVVTLVSVGKYLEARSGEKTKSAITKLMKLTPDTALLSENGEVRQVAVGSVPVGAILLVRAGAHIPLDGVVTEGAGSVNESMLTGESLPVDKSAGDSVVGGSLLCDGAIYFRVTRVGEDTTLAGIVRFIEDAQGKKAPISKTADRVAGVFVPVVMVIALLAGAVWLITGADIPFALNIFTSVLVIACPCAMGLATPTAIMVGTGLGASHGILVRSGEALEITHKTTVAVFDKTGTVTEGKPSVTGVFCAPGVGENELFAAAASLEHLSEHPFAAAIIDAATAHGIAQPPAVTGFESLTGRGLAGNDGNGQKIAAGNIRLMNELGIDCSALMTEAERMSSAGETAVFVARGGVPLGIIALADRIRPGVRDAVLKLGNLGIKTVMLTGDSEAVARRIAGEAGIGEVVAEVLPADKAAVVEKYRADGATVMMIGDGINDAPALTAADVGVAIGQGSDIAIDSADVVLMRSDPADVWRAVRLGRLTIRNIRQNLFWAFCYNVLAIPVAAGLLYPAFRILLTPMIGGLAMSLSSLFVVGNALRLGGKKL